ncbi:sulfate ABC transporter substrate-binding protein [Telmatospirillum sp. J64-1]|uniref:sulfate ABC transporter substrate-binding protein n=1 Tax=Telmatospirillum sp. J64-1 TaxID=2502183 RepID=UPI00115D0C20|nr:sulfate ABC transporter substrate-binding protein [Telmatospirillum sp. J64-1]
MKRTFLALAFAAAAGVAAASAFPAQAQDRAPSEILNVSYDIARELYASLNPVFAEHWQEKTGQSIEVKQSHGGSSRQARAIMEGLQADVVTFNQVTDVQVLADEGLVREDWQSALPHNASPYYSLPAFLVREGNPKNIRDWSDLARDDVQVIFPNPKTSGNARYTYLAAYAFGLEQNGNDDAKAREFVGQVLGNVPVFDTGGRGATTTFVERGIGDVLITFEAEVYGIQREYGEDKYDVVVPSMSLLAEFPVAVVDRVADRRGSRQVAEEYLNFLYSPQAQEILAQFSNRVRDPDVAAKYADQFPEVRLVTVEDVFGGWDQAQKEHFADGGSFDQIFGRRR